MHEDDPPWGSRGCQTQDMMTEDIVAADEMAATLK